MKSIGYKWGYLLSFALLLSLYVIVTASCDGNARLTVENQMNTEIIIFHEDISGSGDSLIREEIGRVPANQTAEMQYDIFLGTLGETVIIQAEDLQRNIIWQRSWTREEFLKINDVKWNIIVSPETNEL